MNMVDLFLQAKLSSVVSQFTIVALFGWKKKLFLNLKLKVNQF